MSPSVRQRLERAEGTLSAFAAKSTDEERAARRVYPLKKDPFRTEFRRDYTRIIHSRPFRRLRNKTQVFVYPKDDHICTRLEHSLHVASVAHTIASALGLNTDLTDAISVGHDLGHAPFGHEGEKALRKVACDNGLTGFRHESQSLRVVDHLESPYPDHPGLNLTFAVRDGILMHYGEDFERESLQPDRERSDLSPQLDPLTTAPATLEGCVVRWADKVAYLGRDFADAIRLEVVKESDLPGAVAGVLGTRNRQMIGTLVRNIVDNSTGDYIAVSAEVRGALGTFNKFNKERIYDSAQVTEYFGQVSNAVVPLFAAIRAELQHPRFRRPEDRPKGTPRVLRILSEFVFADLGLNSVDHDQATLLALDFIGGMTDSFFMSSVEDLFLPRGVGW